MPATHLGLVTTTVPGRTIEVNDQGGITHMVPQTMPHAAALDPATHPQLGTALSIMGSTLTLRGYSIALREDGLAEVQYRYGNAIANDNPNAPTIGVPSYPGRAGTPLTEFYDLDASLESLSLLRHPRYQTLASADLRVLGMMIQLGPLNSDGSSRRAELSGTERAEECADKIEAGTTSYLAPKFIWRYRRLGSAWQSPWPIGKISNPPGPAPSVTNGNWLYMGASGAGWEGGAFEITHTWESSPLGDTWDTQLYGD